MPTAAPDRLRRLAVPGSFVAAVATYALLHTVLLHRVVGSDRERLADLAASGVPVLPLPAGVLAWLPIGSTLQLAALAGLALALAASGRRWAVGLPALLLLVSVVPDASLPTPLDSAWYPYLWLPTSEPVPALPVWVGCVVDRTLLLLPAVVHLAVTPRSGRPLPVREPLLRCVPLLLAVVAVQQWTSLTSGAPVADYLPTALLIVGAALLCTGGLPRRHVLLVLAVLPAAACGSWSWALSGHPEGLAAAGATAAQAGLVALTTAGVVLGSPAVGRWYRARRAVLLRLPAVATPLPSGG